LLVEDNPGDVRLTRETLCGCNNSIHLLLVSDGEEAMTFLRNEGVHKHAPRPDLILLDLNLPKMDGRETLAVIKADENFRTIPIVVLTTSAAEADVAKSYSLKANCYLVKPVKLEEFETMVKSINKFWLSEVTLPKDGQAQGRSMVAGKE
jgi:CheY-like chemotaxis protein